MVIGDRLKVIKKSVYILGPCSAETREQVLLTAAQIKEACGETPFIFRAGVWKPRTSPRTFQGAGEEALLWLAEVKRTFGIDVATEVTTPEQVEAALKAGINYLWIGARSSASPISVQSIAERIVDCRLKIEDFDFKAILIKNPVNADAALWLGNIERLEKTGVPVITIHRGCNHQPCWSMAHTVRLARPDIPMLLDPSHMSGDAAKVPELMQKINELGLNGAMVEIHHNPETALSDNTQQIKPSDLSDILRVNSDMSESIGERIELNWLRAEIDDLDNQLWDIIAARMEVSQRIGQWKKTHNVTPLQPERYQQIVERLKEKGQRLKDSGLTTDFMLRIWELIHEESLKKQVEKIEKN